MKMGCHFSAHHCCDLLLISKWKPYFKNIHVCQALWKKEFWQFATKTRTGTRNHRQQNAFAVLLGRPRQAETESEEGGDKAHSGCSRSLPQSDQSGEAPPEQSNVASLECSGHQQGLHEGFSSPQRKSMGAFTQDMRLSTLACSQHKTRGFAARLDPSTRRWL